MSQKVIEFYDAEAEWGELSNFYRITDARLEHDGQFYPTTEHLYQSMKYIDESDSDFIRRKEYINLIRTASTPNKAKILANKKTALQYDWQKDLKRLIDAYPDVSPRSDWDQRKDEAMYQCLKQKFTKSDHCRKVLLETGDSSLVEHTSRDAYWGDGGNGKGLNKLGQLLMKLRQEILESLSDNDKSSMMKQKIDGLALITDAIDETTEQSLIQIINQQSWETFMKRRVQHYGYRYQYQQRTVTKDAPPIPQFLIDLMQTMIERGHIKQMFDQIIINEYEPGQGITPHIDANVFGEPIISLSLNSNCAMLFQNSSQKIQTFELILPRRSLLILEKDARWKWMHSIPTRTHDNLIKRGKRISITFRYVLPKYQ